MRLAVIARPSDALRLLIAHAVAASGNWRVTRDARRPASAAIEDSIVTSPAQAAFGAEAKAVTALLAPAFKDMDDDEGVSGCAHQDSDVTAAVFQRLLKLKDHEVARIGAFVMAETLASGSAVTDAFGAHAKVSARNHWTPDATFFDLLRDRTTVGAMLADVAGQKAADRLVSAKLKDQKAALATAVAGKEGWCPGWMRFPATVS